MTNALSQEERLAKICLAHAPGFGALALRRLKRAFSSWTHAWLASRSVLLRAGLTERLVDLFLLWREKQDPPRLMTFLTRAGIRMILIEDSDFPTLLRHTADPPEVLFVRGTLPTAPAIALVGTRCMTDYGKSVIKTLVPPLAQGGLCIVSGLALGIDGFVHQTTLDAGGTTLAFLATGLDDDSLYPREHVHLAQRILKEGGCLISESPPKTEGFRHLFPMRNRLIAGFSLATVVIEAAHKSGSLITAKLALEENREVLAVPGPIWSAQSEGTNHLLKLGAKPCTSVQDILDAVAFDRPDLIAKARSQLPTTPQEEEFLALLSQPLHIDALALLANSPVAHVSSQLSILELKGLVQHLGGQTWVKMN